MVGCSDGSALKGACHRAWQACCSPNSTRGGRKQLTLAGYPLTSICILYTHIYICRHTHMHTRTRMNEEGSWLNAHYLLGSLQIHCNKDHPRISIQDTVGAGEPICPSTKEECISQCSVTVTKYEVIYLQREVYFNSRVLDISAHDQRTL